MGGNLKGKIPAVAFRRYRDNNPLCQFLITNRIGQKASEALIHSGI